MMAALQNLTTTIESLSVKMSSMETKMDSMQSSIDCVREMSLKVDNLEVKVNNLTENFQEISVLKSKLEHAVDKSNHANFQAETNKDNISLLEEKIKALEDQLQTVTMSNKQSEKLVEKSLSQLRDSNAKLESYMRRDNLLFLNIKENRGEDCKTLVRDVFKQIKIQDPEAIQITRCHRLRGGSTPRPIICRFHHFSDRSKVWDQRSELQNTDIVMAEDFHPDIAKKRKVLYRIMKEAKAMNMKTGLAIDKLYIDDVPYTVESLHKLPKELQSIANGVKKTDQVIAFFTEKCPFSNFFPVTFNHRGVTFHSVEQFFHFQKAELFGDDETAAKILAATHPAACKALGREVKNFDKTEWDNSCLDIMKVGLDLKFSSNDECRDALIATGNTTLIEASADKFWGSGVPLSNRNAVNISLMKGENHLGKLLEEIRKKIKS